MDFWKSYEKKIKALSKEKVAKPKKKKSRPKPAGYLYSKGAWRREFKQRRQAGQKKRAEIEKKGNYNAWEERVKEAKRLKENRSKALGYTDTVGFHDKYIKRDKKIISAEKKKKVRYSAGTWYV